MRNVKRLLDVYDQLNNSNRFAVLVYARLKIVRQIASEIKPYVRERRASVRVKIRPVHWAGLGL